MQEEKAGLADLTDLVALNPKKKIPFELVEKIELSHNTRLFRFALQSPRHRLGLPIGQHMFFYAKVCLFRCLLCFSIALSTCILPLSTPLYPLDGSRAAQVLRQEDVKTANFFGPWMMTGRHLCCASSM